MVFSCFSALNLLVLLSRSVSIYWRPWNGILIRIYRPLPRSRQPRAPATCLASSSVSRPPPPVTRTRSTKTRPSPRSRRARRPPSRWVPSTRTGLRCNSLFDAAVEKALDLSVHFCRKRSEREIVVGVHIVHVKLDPSSVPVSFQNAHLTRVKSCEPFAWSWKSANTRSGDNDREHGQLGTLCLLALMAFNVF